MKKIGTFQFATMFCACFLGAGFLSGNELCRFFGVFGVKGFIGCAVSVIFIGLFSILTVVISKTRATETPEDVLFNKKYRKTGALFGIIQSLSVFSVTVIMTSGVETLLFLFTGINRNVFGAVFCGLLVLFIFLGKNAVINAFSVTVPIISVLSVLISLILMVKYGYRFSFDCLSTLKSPLLKNGILSAAVYLSYSVILSIGVFSKIGKKTNVNTACKGAAIGSLIMLTVAFSVLLTVGSDPQAANSEMPMLFAAMHLNNICGAIYAALLLIGMFGAALSGIMSLTEYLKVKYVLNLSSYKKAVIVIALAAFFASTAGFGNLVGTLYPLFGYAGFVAVNNN